MNRDLNFKEKDFQHPEYFYYPSMFSTVKTIHYVQKFQKISEGVSLCNPPG